MFKNCPKSQTTTIILRGGAEQFIAEAERSLNDAIMIVRRAIKASKVVAGTQINFDVIYINYFKGGGAIELELSKHLRLYARTIEGKAQLVINCFAKALEIIPRTISDNAGLDSVEILNKLRQKHAQGGG